MKIKITRIMSFRTLLILVLSFVSIIIILPFFWMVSTSLKIPSQIISYPPVFIPRPLYLKNYIRIFTEINFGLFFFNSAYISTLVTLSALFTSSFVGYVFAKFKFLGRDPLFFMILATLMIPLPVTLIPLYLVMGKIGWIDSHLALIIPMLCNGFGVFLMRQFMLTIPDELREASIIDGCSEFGTFFRIILPQSKPILAALGVFVFMFNWNNFLWPLIVLSSKKKFTIPLGLAQLSYEHWVDYGFVMAGATVSLIPIIIIFLIFQRQFVRGIVLTGLK